MESPRLTDASSLYTDGRYESLNPTWHVRDSPWKAGNILRMLSTNGVTPSTICEVGCGAGAILQRLQKTMPGPATFTGYEISPYAYELSKARESERLRFKMGDILDEADAHYDLILMIDLIEHVEDLYGFLRKIREHGEMFVFHIPLDLSVQGLVRAKPLLEARESVGHIHYFYKDTALAVLQESGYDIIDWFYTPGALELTISSLRQRVANGPRKVLYRLHKDLAVRILGGYSLMVLARG